MHLLVKRNALHRIYAPAYEHFSEYVLLIFSVCLRLFPGGSPSSKAVALPSCVLCGQALSLHFPLQLTSGKGSDCFIQPLAYIIFLTVFLVHFP